MKTLLIPGREFYISEDRTLNGSWEYVYYKPGDKTITLDGNFKLDDLRAIILYMELNPK